MNKHNSRKWHLAVSIFVMSCVWVFLGKMSMSEWLQCLGIVTVYYGAATIADKKLNGEAA